MRRCVNVMFFGDRWPSLTFATTTSDQRQPSLKSRTASCRLIPAQPVGQSLQRMRKSGRELPQRPFTIGTMSDDIPPHKTLNPTADMTSSALTCEVRVGHSYHTLFRARTQGNTSVS